MGKQIGRRLIRLLPILALGGVLAAEFLLRITGMVEFPLYHVDEHIGYIPRPSQSGWFQKRHQWHINDKCMGSPPWKPNINLDVLILGDSVVWGGNPYRIEERLGPQLQATLPEASVWSAAAGSWSILNEEEYLRRFPVVWDATDVLVWVINKSDFVSRTQWDSDLIHPRQRVTIASLYCYQKYLLPQLDSLISRNSRTFPETRGPVLPLIGEESDRAFQNRLQEAGRAGKKVVLVLYPDLDDVRATSVGGTNEYRTLFKYLSRWDGLPGIGLLDILDADGWNPSLYRDQVHPTPGGVKVLAEAIADSVRNLRVRI